MPSLLNSRLNLLISTFLVSTFGVFGAPFAFSEI